MKKFFLLLLLAASPAFAQNFNAAIGGYYYNGSAFAPLTSTYGGGTGNGQAISASQLSGNINLYCLNTGTQLWVPATSACFGSGSGGDTITSPNSTLSVGPSPTATTLDLNLANPNTWTGIQSFTTNPVFNISFAPTISAANMTNVAVSNAATFNNSNTGATSGQTYNGASAQTISSNTLGAGSLANANTWSAANTFTSTVNDSYSPTLTNTAINFTGLPGIGTGAIPWMLFSTGGAPTWNTGGTWVGFNCPASGVALDLEGHNVSGTQAWAIQCNGTGSFNGGVVTTNITNTPVVIASSATPTFNTGYSINRIVLTASVTSSTIGAGGNGQRECFLILQNATGNFTFAWPTNVVGGMTVGLTASKRNQQCFNYSTTDALWEAESGGTTNF